jgi:phosphate transport system substrate-binding protein
MLFATKKVLIPVARTALWGALAVACADLAGCKKPTPVEVPAAPVPVDTAPEKSTIRSVGPDGLLPLARAWIAEHDRLDPSISFEVAAGGAEPGATALAKGTADLAYALRKATPDEADAFAKAGGGKPPKETVAGFEALCVYVNNVNPLDTLGVEQLRQIFRAGGGVNKWADLGVKRLGGAKGADNGKLARVRLSPASAYFREVVLGDGAAEKPGALEMNDVDAVIAMVAASPGALACAPCRPTAAAKLLKIAATPGAPGVPATAAEIGEGRYPLARPLWLQTAAQPPAPVQRYLDWVLSETGQQIVERAGFVRRAP